ncbi:MAG: GNAT family N-acetyltransferase [Pseudomonadota bacterium]|nr:GNAT family N-acetyltransferase [Pseudomonadota bacterium]
MRVHIEQRFVDLPGALTGALCRPQINPFFCSAFLGALEESGCVTPAQGWQPCHVWIEDQGEPVFFLPLYSKTHSWGEFVFDQSWASAYHRHGLNYYPKLVSAIPFTPSQGPRWWVKPGADESRLWTLAKDHIELLLRDGRASSWHLLFSERRALPVPDTTALVRRDTQFHWRNQGYADFDDFLAQMKSRKRKSMRRERSKVLEQGVTLQRRLGHELAEKDWIEFYACYCNTYHERGMSPYLTLDFFLRVGTALAHNIMMVQAHRHGSLVAAAICFFDDTTLYGRHWGALQEVDCLHFEACFYQGIEFCIERGLQHFDPGTQGEHKLLRGFEPVPTQSWHWIAHSAFRDAIADFLQAEIEHTERYREQAAEYLPFRESETP